MKLEKIIPRSKNFADWYTSVVSTGKLMMYSSVKGSIIFEPNGWAIWNNIQKEIDKRFAKQGIRNVSLPLFINNSEFNKEKSHIEGFAPEVFKAYKNSSDEPYILRPTSEVNFCNYFKKIINSYNDLPIKYNQWCNIFRAEKNTKPFLRTIEFFWQELHTAHSSEQEAQTQALTTINEYHDFMEKFLCVPTIIGKKTPQERFAGALNTYTVEALMQDGQALQCGTSHYLGQNFAKTYEILFQTNKNTQQHVYQTSAGVSTRLIGAIVMSHADDRGLVLPFNVAPYQVAVITIAAEKDPTLIANANTLKSQLDKYNVLLDTTNKQFGFKISEQEVKGTPFTIILGSNDLKNNQYTIFRRDLGTKEIVAIKDICNYIETQKIIYDANLLQKAKTNLENNIVKVNSFEEFKQALNDKKMIIANWGGNSEDELKLKKETGATTRCIKEELTSEETCFFTKKPATQTIYFARAY